MRMAMASNGKRPLALVDARLIDPVSGRDEMGGLLAIDGRIVEVGPWVNGEGLPDDAEVVACQGHCLVPGLIDMRVQLREPGEEHMETIASGAEAAAAGGVTSMVCLPNTDPIIDDVAAVEFVARRARETRLAKVYCYAAVTKALEGRDLVEMGLLAESGALAYARAFGRRIIQHPEEPRLADGGMMNTGELATRLGLAGIPAAAEVMMIERDLHLVAMTGASYHAAHISTAAAVEVIRGAKARGLPVTSDTQPAYFTLNETAVGDYRTFAKLSPPLRSEEDRQTVAAAVADGTIDCVASDHAPYDQESKRVPFAHAAAGIIGLETLLPLTLELHHKGEGRLIELLRRVTSAPADLLGLPQGRLAKGAPADLLLFDLDRPGRIDVDRLRSKSKNSPFDGHPIQGRALRSIVDGRSVFVAEG